MQDPHPLSRPGAQALPAEPAEPVFATVRRGLDPEAVHRHLEEVAGRILLYRKREEELRTLLAEAEQRASAPSQLDEATLTAALGAETGRVLQAAHQAAHEVVAKAEQRGAQLLQEAEELLARRTEEADREAALLLEGGRREAVSLLQETREESRAMVEEAREARRRILADLAGRRRDLHVQLEQIRAAKDSLTGLVDDVARAVEQVRSQLLGSEEEARQAAEGAARSASLEPDERPLDQLVAEALAGLPPEHGPGEQVPEEVAAQEPAPPLDAAPEEPPVSEPPVSEPVASGEPPPPVQTGLDRPGPDQTGPAEAVPEEGAPEGPAEEAAAGEPAVEAPGEALLEAPGGPGEAGGSGAGQVVDELFARIRASRAEEVAQARALLEDPEVIATALGEEATDRANGAAAVVDGAAGASPGEEPEGASEPGGEPADGTTLRRDALLEPAGTELERAIKRLLRSEQNELLDVARRSQGGDPGELLPGPAERSRLAEAVRPALERASAAGSGFAAELLGLPRADGGPGEPADPSEELAIEQVAAELADEVVDRIRERLEEDLGRGGSDGSLGALVGVAFREWRGERVERLAGDFAVRAFSSGILRAARREGALVRWALGGAGQPCPDCDDNALAEPQAPGEAFPTGQPAPPVHPGCRCLLLPVLT